jgi:hypothetical protein
MNALLGSFVPAHVDARATALMAPLLDAFDADPVARTFYPGDEEYQAHFPGLLATSAGRAFEAGFVDSYPAGLGAALWLPPGIEPDGAVVDAHLAATVPPRRMPALAAGLGAAAALRPKQPHWTLAAIGVPCPAQGAGIGSMLLRQGLARIDADGAPAYLEATDRRSAALFASFGFVVTGIVLVPCYPQVITMRRPARRRG